jgi:superfamily II DNA or RNA helicase
MQNIIITYSLNYVEDVDGYLPSAFFVREHPGGTLGYMVARAVPENIDSYGIPVAGTPHEALLKACNQLGAETLEEKYQARSRRRLSLQEIAEDPQLGTLLHQYIQRKMHGFLELICRTRVPLCLDIQRQVSLEQFRVRYMDRAVEPVLAFRKTDEAIEYRMHLRLGENVIIPREHDVHIILDEPGYLLIDYQLYTLKYLNGNKLKPFLTKSEIIIPERLTRTYFEKFIMDVVNKVEIEAEGFDVEQIQDIHSVSAILVEDFLENRYVLDLLFNYGETTFQASDPNQRRNRLIIDPDGRVHIRHFVRSDMEREFLEKLEQIGLQRNTARRFFLPEQERKYDLIHWVIDHSGLFTANRIKLDSPLVNNRPVVLEKADILLDTITDNDWFDIRGTIRIGDFTLHFADLIESIRNDDPMLVLPDGSVFIIPERWMSQYGSLARFGKRHGDAVRINKSQYTLAEESDSLAPAIQQAVVSDEDIEYFPDPDLKAELRPYQLEGVKWLLKHRANHMGACLADDMGLGKTLQTLAVLSDTKKQMRTAPANLMGQGQLRLFEMQQEDLSHLRALILLPASLVFNWVEEIRKFCPHFTVCSYIGVERKELRNALEHYDVVLTTYQTALRDIQILQKINWAYIILDESHMIKNRESRIFRAVNTLKTGNKISLSGTPIENSLADLWSQMQFINPDLLGTFSFFKEHFLIPVQKQGDEAALQQLRSMVDPFILRRRKKDVANDLPEISEQIEYVPMTLEQAELFEEEKSAARNFLLGISEHAPDYTFHVFSSLLRLRQIANHPVLVNDQYQHESGKFNQVLEYLFSVLKSGHKVLIFSSFTSHLALFAEKLKKEKIHYCQLTGQTAQKDRKEQVDRFQNDMDYPVFLISMKAGGIGLNLTRADYVFILDPWWNPFVESQAIARAHRIGREQPITVIRFISKDSIEEKIIRLQARKKVLAAEMIEDQEQISLAREDLMVLLE